MYIHIFYVHSVCIYIYTYIKLRPSRRRAATRPAEAWSKGVVA